MSTYFGFMMSSSGTALDVLTIKLSIRLLPPVKQLDKMSIFIIQMHNGHNMETTQFTQK